MINSQTTYLNISFVFAIISMHLPLWFNGKHASIFSIIITIIADNIGLNHINSVTIILFLTPLYFIYFVIFKNIDSKLIKVLLLIFLIIINLPLGSMLPPR